MRQTVGFLAIMNEKEVCIECIDLDGLMNASPDDFLNVYVQEGEKEFLYSVKRKDLSNFRITHVNGKGV